MIEQRLLAEEDGYKLLEAWVLVSVAAAGMGGLKSPAVASPYHPFRHHHLPGANVDYPHPLWLHFAYHRICSTAQADEYPVAGFNGWAW